LAALYLSIGLRFSFSAPNTGIAVATVAFAPTSLPGGGRRFGSGLRLLSE
jgi:hypothetical protein